MEIALKAEATDSSDTQKKHEEIPLWTGVFLMINSIVGGGIVEVPLSYYNLGVAGGSLQFITGIVLNVLVVIVALYSIWLLLQSKNISGKSSYSEIGYVSFGRCAIFVINIFMALNCLGISITYFYIFGTTANDIFKHATDDKIYWISKEFFVLVLAVLILYFVLRKEIQQLKIASLIVFACIWIFIIMMAVIAARDVDKIQHQLNEDPKGSATFNWGAPQFSVSTFGFIGQILVAFTFQVAYFPIYSVLKGKSDKQGMKLGYYTLSIVFIVYTYIGVMGVYIFRSLTGDEDTILKNIGKQATLGLSIVCQVIFMILAAFHAPIIFFIGKESTLIIVDEIVNGSIAKEREKMNEFRRSRGYKMNKTTDFVPQIEDSIRRSVLALSKQVRSESHHNQSIRTMSIFEPMKKDGKSREEGDTSINQFMLQEKSNKKEVVSQPKYLEMKPWLYYTVTIVVYVIVVLIAYLITDVSIVFQILGGGTSPIVCFMLPSLFYLKLEKNTKKKILPFLFFLMSCLVEALELFSTIYHAVTKESEEV